VDTAAPVLTQIEPLDGTQTSTSVISFRVNFIDVDAGLTESF
jgi:hypothetical protein